MFKVSVLYPNTPGARFDFDYYRQTHIPMVLERCAGAVTRGELERGVGGAEPGSPAPFRIVGHLFFESATAMQESFGKHLPEFVADLPNFTDITPILQLSEVEP